MSLAALEAAEYFAMDFKFGGSVLKEVVFGGMGSARYDLCDTEGRLRGNNHEFVNEELACVGGLEITVCALDSPSKKLMAGGRGTGLCDSRSEYLSCLCGRDR